MLQCQTLWNPLADLGKWADSKVLTKVNGHQNHLFRAREVQNVSTQLSIKSGDQDKPLLPLLENYTQMILPKLFINPPQVSLCGYKTILLCL